jgi:hypothetical protein
MDVVHLLTAALQALVEAAGTELEATKLAFWQYICMPEAY